MPHLVATALMGATLLCVSDVVGQNGIRKHALPVGVVTLVLGWAACTSSGSSSGVSGGGPEAERQSSPSGCSWDPAIASPSRCPRPMRRWGLVSSASLSCLSLIGRLFEARYPREVMHIFGGVPVAQCLIIELVEQFDQVPPRQLCNGVLHNCRGARPSLGECSRRRAWTHEGPEHALRPFAVGIRSERRDDVLLHVPLGDDRGRLDRLAVDLGGARGRQRRSPTLTQHVKPADGRLATAPIFLG